MRQAILISCSIVCSAIIVAWVLTSESRRFNRANLCENLRAAIGHQKATIFFDPDNEKAIYEVGKSKYELGMQCSASRGSEALEQLVTMVMKEEGLTDRPVPRFIRCEPPESSPVIAVYEKLYGVKLSECIGI